MNISLNIMYFSRYLYMLCILAVNVMSRRCYSEVRDEIKLMPVCMLPLAGRVRTLCNLRLQCLPYDRENDFCLEYISHLILTLY